MAAKNQTASQFRSDIEALIAEVEACMRQEPMKRDREFDFQHQAFRERRRQATTLASQLSSAGRSQWPMRSGDAYRIRESLKLSLTYFRGLPLN